jgi:hypothetical protein
VSYREIYDVKPGLDNLFLPIKIARLFIRYLIRLVGYDKGLRVLKLALRLIDFMPSSSVVSYIKYLIRINLYKVNCKISLYTTGLSDSVAKKIEWSEYTISESTSLLSRSNAKGYLSLLSRNGFYDKANFHPQPVIDQRLATNSFNKNIYIYGPNSKEPPSLKYKDYLLVVLKPVDFDLTPFKEKLLFVNGYYYSEKLLNNKKLRSELFSLYGRVIVSSLSDIVEPFEKAKFPMSGNISAPMALGRVIYNLIFMYGRSNCIIEGFDFYLNNETYANYYPTLTKIKGEVDERTICESLAEHDALYNFLYVKELAEYLNIEDSTEFKDIINKSGGWYLSSLNGTRNFSLLKSS